MGKLKRLKHIRLHREGTNTLVLCFVGMIVLNAILYFFLPTKIPFYVVAAISIVVYSILVNFFRCPIRIFGQETEGIVVAPADGRVVVI